MPVLQSVFDRATIKIFLRMVVGYTLLCLPTWFWPGYLDTPLGVVAVIPLMAIYVFHAIGIPGLLQHDGMCGWGWCAPTLAGWVFLVAFWLFAVCLLAKLISGLVSYSQTEG